MKQQGSFIPLRLLWRQSGFWPFHFSLNLGHFVLKQIADIPHLRFLLNLMTNWLEDHLNGEQQHQQQQESTLFSREIDASKQHQQTWPAITLEGVLHWEHHYRPCVVCEIKVGFVKKSLVVGVCCLLNQTLQWNTQDHVCFLAIWNKTRNRIKHGEAMIALLMIALLSNRIEKECGSSWKVLS